MATTTRLRLRVLGFWIIAIGAAAVSLATIGHHIYRTDFPPLAAFCLPVVVVFFAFTSLLYMRGRSLSRSKSQIRTLFAAERSMQGAVAYLTGIVLGASLYGMFQASGFAFDPESPGLAGLWLLLFLVPFGFMQTGFTLLLSAVWVIVPQMLRPVSAYEVWRRIRAEDMAAPTPPIVMRCQAA